jgi:hypothetical protein
MAGIVRAYLTRHADKSFDVSPLDCPAADVHTSGTPRCYTIMFDGQRRACPFWTATAHPANETHRMDPTALCDEAYMRQASQMRCSVICQRARANRPPGC